MSRLPALLRRHEALTLEIAQLEAERSRIRAEILAVGRDANPKRRKRATRAAVTEAIRQTVKVLRDADEPLPRREIAARLRISPWATSYRLAKAISAGYVESAGGGRYRVTNVVPAVVA